MYLITRSESLAEMEAYPPFGPGFKDIPEGSYMEVWGSEFNMDGDDFTEFRLFDTSGTLIKKARVGGY